MGRLTRRMGIRGVLINYEHRTCESICRDRKEENCDGCLLQEVFDKLAHYEDMEEQGRLIELPCAVGEIVWIARDGVPVQESIFFRESDILCLVEDGYIFGTTKEEAEAKLKELEGDKE